MRIGIAGAGFMGSMHARILASLPGIELAGICGKNPGRYEKLAKEFGIARYDGLGSMLKDPSIDATDDGHQPGQVLTTLKRAKIRGVESYSMVASEKELGISEEHTGIILLDEDAPVGTPLVEYMGDAVLDISIVPNMARNANVLGVARELAARVDLIVPLSTQALQAAIHHLVPSWHRDGTDSPDEVITAVRRMPAADAVYAPMPDGIDPRLVQALSSRGISGLYTHQAAAVRYAMAGESVVVTTPTASGKTTATQTLIEEMHAVRVRTPPGQLQHRAVDYQRYLVIGKVRPVAG